MKGRRKDEAKRRLNQGRKANVGRETDAAINLTDRRTWHASRCKQTLALDTLNRSYIASFVHPP